MWRHAATQGRVEQAGGTRLALWSLYHNGGNKKEASEERALSRSALVSGGFPGLGTFRRAHDEVTAVV